jgi:hypothetical protein
MQFLFGVNMIHFVRTTAADESTLRAWIDADPWHSYKDAVEWWINVGGYLTFKLVDKEGDVLFVRLDREGPDGTMVRLHTQFAPKDAVSEKRVAIAINFGITAFIPHGVASGIEGIITESVSPKLIAFLESRMGFKRLDNTDDYVLYFNQGEI